LNTISTNFRLSYKLQDESFNLSQGGDCNLYITLSPSTIRLAVADIERNKFVVLEDYELVSIFTPSQVAEQLTLLAEENPLLQQQRWHAVRVSTSNQHFTLVPETLFDPASKQDYLQLHSELNLQQDIVHYYRHTSMEAVNIFSVDGSLQKTVENLFPTHNVQFIHQTSAVIKGVLQQPGRSTSKGLYIFVEHNYVTILVVSETGLQFCNIFHYQSPEDFIYYIIFVMQEQKLNPEQETIYVWGDITHDSALFSMLQKYIRAVKLGKRPADVAYSYKFEDLFEHRYFEVFSLHLCE
jgi:hypothetical protein